MTTLAGNWVGSSPRARIVCVYTMTHTADNTQAIFKGTLYLETDGPLTDSVNSLSVSGDDGSWFSSNKNFSIPSGGGSVAFYINFSFQKYGDGSISASISNLEGVGATVSATFSLDAGALAPYLTSGYSAIGITGTGFTTGGVHASGNGGVLNGMQIEVKQSLSDLDLGSVFFTQETFTNPVATGLIPNEYYYFRLRVRNSTYGWSAWGAWVMVKTASTIPNAPYDIMTIGSLGQFGFTIGNIVVVDGGAPVDTIRVRLNTAMTDVGATDIDTPGVPDAVSLTDLTPGTTYYVKVAAHNVHGWGPFSAWIQVQTNPGVLVNVGGTYKVASAYVNIGGIWKPATRWVCVSPGVWKQ